MAIREYELEDGKNYFFFATHKYHGDKVSIRLLLMEHAYTPQYRVGGRVYKFKILKDYFHIWPTAGQVALHKPGDMYQIYVLKPLYKDNYRTMKRRFIRKVLGANL